jgi:hypothetical protein
MAKPPDVRVRLSAEGVDEVVKAFEKVSKEAGHAKHEVGLLGEMGEQLKELLPILTLAVAVDKMIELGKSAFESAEQLGKLSQKTGASVETLSVLSLAATQAHISQDDLSTSLQRLIRSMSDASAGAAKPASAFKQLGISMKEVRNTDAGEMFVKIANKLDGLDSATRKAALSQELFSRGGANMLPLLQEIAGKGFEEVRAKAERFGVYLDTDMIAAVKHADDALGDMQAMTRGVATQFEVGAAPGIANAIDEIVEQVSGSKTINGFRTLGEYAGNAAKAIALGFTVAGQTVATVIALIEEQTARGKAVLQGFVQGGIVGAATALVEAPAGDSSRMKAIVDNYLKSIKQSAKDLFGADSKKREANLGNRGGVGDTTDLTALHNARIAFLKAAADNELALQKTRNKLAEDENKRTYEDGLQSLESYYTRREQLTAAQADNELANLRQKLKLSEDEETASNEAEIKKQEQIAQLKAQIQERELQKIGELKALQFERANAERQHNIDMLGIEQQLANAEGNRFRAALLALDQEIAKTDELLRKQGVGEADREAHLKKIREQGQARIQVGQSSQDASIALDDLSLAQREIQRKADRGEISQIAAKGQIIQLQREELQHLREIGAEMTANADKANDKEAIQAAKDYNAQLDDMEAHLHRVGNAAAELADQIATQFRDSITASLTDAITSAKSFGDAWKDIGKAFEQIIARMIAQVISFYLVLLLLKAINPDAADALEAQGPFGQGFAEGGYTGDIPANKAAGVVHGKEFVFTAAATRKWGRPLLEAMNKAAFPGWSALASGGYAGGGYVEPSGGAGAAVEINVINGTGQPVQQSQRTGGDGKQIIDIVIGAVAQDIAQGGKVAQTIQRTYSVGRSGVKIG